MKAIYLNIDPYLQAVADWLNAGKPGTVPSFQPLPVAVTIPLGESACIYLPAQSASDASGKINPEEPDEDWDPASVTVSGVSIGVAVDPVSASDLIDSALTPGFSSVAPAMKYAVAKFSGGPVKIYIVDGSGTDLVAVTIPVLVRRETASGPVDLVDFTPPVAAPTAAQINAALGGTGAAEGQPLKGVSLTGATGAIAGVDIYGAMWGDETLTTGPNDATQATWIGYDITASN